MVGRLGVGEAGGLAARDPQTPQAAFPRACNRGRAARAQWVLGPEPVTRPVGGWLPVAWHRATDLGRSWLRLPDHVPPKHLGVSCTQIRATGNSPAAVGCRPRSPLCFGREGARVRQVSFRGEGCHGVFSAPPPGRASVLQLRSRVRPGTLAGHLGLAPWKRRWEG